MLKQLSEMSVYELASLTDTQVESLIDVEFMHRGIVPHLAPPIPEVMQEPTIGAPTHKVWKVSLGGAEVYFDSVENAQKALDLEGLVSINYEWVNSDRYSYANPERSVNPEMTTLPIYEMGVAKTFYADHRKWKSLADERKKAMQEWEESQENVQEVRDEVWDSVHKARSVTYRLDSILDTEEKYIKMAGGDVEVAQKFLANAFSITEIEQAQEWKQFSAEVGNG